MGAVGNWVLLTGLYLLFAGQASRSEIVAGIVLGTLVTLFRFASGKVEHRRFAFHAPWPRLGLHALIALLRDTLQVGAALLRAIAGRDVHGQTTRQPFREGGPTEQDAARRALSTLGASFGPNGYVVSVEPGALVMHRLVPDRPKPDREWPV